VLLWYTAVGLNYLLADKSGFWSNRSRRWRRSLVNECPADGRENLQGPSRSEKLQVFEERVWNGSCNLIFLTGCGRLLLWLARFEGPLKSVTSHSWALPLCSEARRGLCPAVPTPCGEPCPALSCGWRHGGKAWQEPPEALCASSSWVHDVLPSSPLLMLSLLPPFSRQLQWEQWPWDERPGTAGSRSVSTVLCHESLSSSE